MFFSSVLSVDWDGMGARVKLFLLELNEKNKQRVRPQFVNGKEKHHEIVDRITGAFKAVAVGESAPVYVPVIYLQVLKFGGTHVHQKTRS